MFGLALAIEGIPTRHTNARAIDEGSSFRMAVEPRDWLSKLNTPSAGAL